MRLNLPSYCNIASVLLPLSGDEVQGVAWQQSGRLLATQSRDKRLRVIDPRVSADSADCVAAETDSHGGIKDSKVVWVGQNSDRILTTGFSTVID